MKITNVHKLYASNFLTGLVFWYGIEKLFMQSIGINAVGVGTITAILIVFLVLFDIPSGLLADKWSRKGMLTISALSLAACSFILGSSTGLMMYTVGILFYGLYIVATSGTYGAIMYDTLHEEDRAASYSKVQGKAYGLFLVGAGVGNVAGGFLAHHFSYSFSYYLTIISCLLNVLVILTIHEPMFHKVLDKQRFLRQLGAASLTIAKLKLLRALTVVMTLLSVAELFKLDFGQLYMFRYITAPQAIGILWAVYAFAMAFGSVIAHRFRARLHILVIFASVPYVLMSFIDNAFSLVLFMIQVIAAAALINQIETRIQENTKSSVRTSVLSVVSTIGRIVTIPASFLLGWLIRDYNALWAVRFIALVLVAMLLYWLWAKRRIPQANKPEVAKEDAAIAPALP
ncbi:MAG TPA: MFS transporter [Candidatus Saccharimonadales bacterium]|nr:MFS transporter [Candidatus Saccharimonadales bacterium]